MDRKIRRPVAFRFNEAQVKFYKRVLQFKKRERPVRIIACKSRRAGLSTIVEGLLYHDTTTNDNTYSLICGNQNTPSANVLGMCRLFHKSTPEKIAGMPFRPRLPESYRGSPPADRLDFPDLGDEGSHIFIASAKSIDKYLSFGFQNIHATEVAYYDDGLDFFRALSPTLVNVPHSMLVLESTPNGKVGKGQFFYEQVQEAVENEELDNWEYGATRLVFIPWWEMTLSFALPFADSEKRAAFAKQLTSWETDFLKQHPTVMLEQLLWRRATIYAAPFNTDEDLFDQEYPTDLETAFLSRGSSVYGRKNIKRYLSRVREPIWHGDIYWGKSDKENDRERVQDIVKRPRFLTAGESEVEGFASHTNEGTRNNLKVWRWPQKGERVFICGDVGGGDPDTKRGDYSTLQVGVLGDWRDTHEIIMRWKGHLNPLPFAELASALAWAILYRVGDEVVAPELAVEWNGPGIPFNTYLDRFDLYPHTYRYVQVSVHGQKKSHHIGWESNDKTKPQMIKFSARMVETDAIDIPDRATIMEMECYKQIDDYGGANSYEGEAGMHDDLVSAFQILCVRLRMSEGENDSAGVEYTDDMAELGGGRDTDGDETIPWDPFDDSLPAEGESEEVDEETLFWQGYPETIETGMRVQNDLEGE